MYAESIEGLKAFSRRNVPRRKWKTLSHHGVLVLATDVLCRCFLVQIISWDRIARRESVCCPSVSSIRIPNIDHDDHEGWRIGVMDIVCAGKNSALTAPKALFYIR